MTPLWDILLVELHVVNTGSDPRKYFSRCLQESLGEVNKMKIFKNFQIILFIYLWLCWVFMAARAFL